jgi:RNA polymerase sigma-70 factor, ECF subfamily
MNPSSNTEREFLERLDRHQAMLHRLVALYARGTEERRDLLQEILFQLWQARERYRGEAKLGTWIYRIALNTAITGLRQARRRPQQVPLDRHTADRPNEPEPVVDPRLQALQSAIRTLPPVDRGLVLLHLEERSYEEIAEVLGISVNHVGVKLTRIRHKLRDLVEQER